MFKERIQQLIRYHKLKHLFERYERVLMPTTLVSGVIVDAITFRSIKIEITFLLLAMYFLFAGFAIVFLNLYDPNRLFFQRKSIQYVRLITPFIIQFTFGALLSASLIFYWFSGAISVSWPLLVVVVLLMVSNDVFRRYYLKPVVQFSVYFFVLFSLLSLALPFAFHSIDAIWFYVSGVVSFLMMYVIVAMLSRSIPSIHVRRPNIMMSVVIIFMVMNALYVLDLIPPIPLSLREAGAYHSVTRSGGGYKVLGESESFLDSLVPGQTIHVKGNSGQVFVFASIFAPTELNTTIVHEWNYFDEAKETWAIKDRLTYRISGGREDGYRGYSKKSSVTPGKWRVDVQTEKGQTIGRIRFDVEMDEQEPKRIEIRK